MFIFLYINLIKKLDLLLYLYLITLPTPPGHATLHDFQWSSFVSLKISKAGGIFDRLGFFFILIKLKKQE